jgi:hypothetical protein
VKSTVVEPAIVKSVPMKPTSMKSAKSAPVEPGHRVKPAAVKSTASAMETPAPAVWPGIGKIWLAKRGSA